MTTLNEIAPPATDAVTTFYPTNIGPEHLVNGSGEYYRPIEKDEGKDVLYRTKTAQWVLEAMNDPNASKAILSSLPENYKLFEHVKQRPVSFSISNYDTVSGYRW